MMSAAALPLSGLRVLELAGLAPGPFTGLLLSDFGADVLRIDRPAGSCPAATPDTLARRKSSLTLSLKSAGGIALFHTLISRADILIDPYRPGVLEKLGLGPDVLLRRNPRLIIARLTGFRRDGKYKDMAGHDINYIALAGVLAMLGRKGEKPYAPGNLIGDFAAGGLTCFIGVLLALLHRGVSGRGQVVEANMVDGAAYLASFLRFTAKGPLWDRARGENVLDGGCPWYDTYETKDGGYMAVGCLEEKFYRAFVGGLGLKEGEMPDRMDRGNWERLRELFEEKFKNKTRAEWEEVFDGTDACVTPVLSFDEIRKRGHKMRPVVDLNVSPGLAMDDTLERDELQNIDYRRGQGDNVEGVGYDGQNLVPGAGGEEALRRWLGYEKGRQYDVVADGGFEMCDGSSKAKL